MGWRFVRTPDQGRYAAFSEVVDDFVCSGMSRLQALDFARSQGAPDPVAKIKSADEPSPYGGGDRFLEALESIRIAHGAAHLRKSLISNHLNASLGLVAPLEGVPGLLEAESPLEWAHETLELVDQGDHASIFSHPDQPSVVIRLSDYPDGAFGYADRIQREETIGADIHGPMAFSLAYIDGHYFGTFERLCPIDEDAEAISWVEAAVRFVSRQSTASDVELLKASQPLLLDMLMRMGSMSDVSRVSNWMLRDRHLVLNDPIGTMTTTEVQLFIGRYGRPRPAPSPGL